MSVNVSDGSLDFVARLDNSDFRDKSLENLRLIKMQLELTGDTSGITKYDEAVKNALATETKLRNDLAKILEEARIKTEEFTQQVQQSSGNNTIFSDSAAEIEAYVQSTQAGIGEVKTVLQSYQETLAGLVLQQQELTASYEAGQISLAEYTEKSAILQDAQAVWAENIATVTSAQTENAAATERASVAAEEQIGILENLKLQLKELQAENLGIVDEHALAQSNARIQELEADIARMSNVGKVGFDEFGNKIEQSVEKTNKFQTAISRATDLTNIGARAVTQLSRQIIGLGVGMLSFVIGAKAIEALIDYLSHLNDVNNKLNEAQQSAKYFSDAIAGDDVKKAVSSVAELTENIKLAKDGFLNKNEVLNEYNKTLGASIGYTDNLNKAEQLLLDKGQDYIKLVMLKAAANLALADASKKQLEIAKIEVSNTDPNAAENDKKDFSGFENLTLWERLTEAFAQDGSVTQKLLEDGKARALKTANDEHDGLMKIFDKIQEQAAKLAQGRKLGFFDGQFDDKNKKAKDAQADLNSLLQAEISLREKIRSFTQKQEDKQLNPDQSALAAVSDQFDSVIFQIDQANAKYDAFVKKWGINAVNKYNSDPKNTVKLAKTDPNVLNEARQQAIDNQANVNENNYIEQDIAKKKKLYADYEAYKIKAGSTAANAEYEDLLKSGADFSTYLNNIKNSIDSSDQSGPIQKRRELVQKSIDENAEDQKKAFQNLLESTLTYEQQREAIIQTWLDNEKKLLAAGLKEQADQEAKNTADRLTALEEAQFKSLDAYKAVFNGVAQLTRQQTQDNLNKLYGVAAAGLATGQLSYEAYYAMIKQLNSAETALKNSGTAQTLDEIGGAFGQIAQEISKVNGTLGSLVSSAGSALSSLSNVIKQVNQLKQNKANGDTDFFSSANLQSEISVASTAISGTVSLINSITSAAAERKAAEKAYYDSVIASQNEYNISLDEQLRLQAELNKNIFYKDIKSDILNASKALSQANKQFEDSLGTLAAQGQGKVGTKSVVNGSAVASDALTGAATGAAIGSLFSPAGTVIGAAAGALVGAVAGLFSKKPKDVLAPILAAYPQLLQKDTDGVEHFNEALAKNLIQNNLVSDSTKVLLQNTIALNDEREATIQQINQDITDLAGSLGTDLQNALVNAFENGTDAAVAFGQSVSKVIDNIVAQFLFQDIFGDQFKKLQTNLQNSFGISGDQNATDDLTQFFKDAKPLVAQYEQALQQVKDAGAANGLDLFDSNTSSSGITGQIQQSITEETGTRLEGALNGIQLNTLNANNILETQALTLGQIANMANSQLAVMTQIAQNTKRGADNTDGISETLNKIASNTSSSAATELRAAGKYGY